jgi:transcriptional regulator with XRE-family HTH domain
MEVTTAGRAVDASTANLLRKSYANLVKAGHNSVRAAWRFGQTLDSFSDRHTGYTQLQLAEATGLSTGTIYKYRRFHGLYQTPELAVQASGELETYDIGALIELRNQLAPVPHGRPLAGRHWRYRCGKCQSHEVIREEIDADGNLVAAGDELEDVLT